MYKDPILTIEADADPADRQIIERGLQAFNRQHADDENHQPLTILLRDAEAQVIAGLLGDTII